MIVRIVLLSILATFCVSSMASLANAAELCTLDHLETISTDNARDIIELSIQSPIVGKLYSISHDGTMLVTQTEDGVVLWNLCHAQILFSLKQQFPIAMAQFSPDDASLAIVGDSLTMLDTQTKTIRFKTVRNDLWDAAFSPDGQLVASAAGQENICPDDMCGTRYNLGNNVLIQRTDTGEIAAIIWRSETDFRGFSGVAFSPDGSTLATLGSMQYLYFWNVEALKRQEYTPLGEAWVEQQGGGVAFAPDGKQIAISYALLQTGGDGYATLPSPVTASVYSVDSLLGLTKLADTPAPVQEIVDYIGASRVTYNRDGSIIALYGQSNWPSLWNAKTGENLITFQYDESLVLSPDEHLVITSNMQKELRFWGVLSPAE